MSCNKTARMRSLSSLGADNQGGRPAPGENCIVRLSSEASHRGSLRYLLCQRKALPGRLDFRLRCARLWFDNWVAWSRPNRNSIRLLQLERPVVTGRVDPRSHQGAGKSAASQPVQSSPPDAVVCPKTLRGTVASGEPRPATQAAL